MSESGTIANGGAPLDNIHLTEHGRIIVYSGLLLAAELVVALYFIAATHGWLWQLPGPVTTDFVSFYAAGSLVDAGTPALAYHREAHYAAEQIAAASGIEYNYFYYPPIFLLLCGLLARLPYLAAFLLFEGLALGLYLFVARKILGERDWSALIPVLAFPAVLWNIGLGQNALLTATLFGSAIFFVDRRPVLAGLLFGALCYKPQFGLLVPVALAAGRNWRAFAAACATVIALVLLTLVLFGTDTWRDFLAAASGAHVDYESGRVKLSAFFSVFGGVRVLGGSAQLGYSLQAAVGVIAAVAVWLVWRRETALPARAASLVAATLVASPFIFFYDQTLAAVGVLWMIREPFKLALWERVVLATLFLASLNSVGLTEATHFPVGPTASVAFAALVARHVFGGTAQSEEAAV